MSKLLKPKTKKQKTENTFGIACYFWKGWTFGSAYWDISYCLGSLPLLKTHCIALNKKTILVFGMARNSFILNIAFRSNHVAVI